MEQIYLKAVQINNFRNLQNAPILLKDKINVFYGLNANGKTNILEAIFYILKQKSFKRDANFENMISIDSKEDMIKFSSLFKIETNEMSYSGKLTTLGKESFLNGKKTKEKIKLNPIFLNPYDSYLFFSNSGFRKRTIDYITSEINISYKTALLKYVNILKQRNAVISQNQSFKIAQAIDQEYSKILSHLSKERIEALKIIKDSFQQQYSNIFGQHENINIEITNSLSELSCETIKRNLEENKEVDYKLGYTKINLNNEDLIIKINNNDFKVNASFGQQKIAYISLMLSAAKAAERKNSVKQILLIDDLSNEIDHKKLKNLFNELLKSETQVVITTANYKIDETLNQLEGINFKEVKQGKILQ